MKIRTYRVTNTRHMEPTDEPAMTAEWVNDETVRWLDVEGATREELRGLLSPLNLHPLLFENSLDPPEGPRVTTYENALFLHMPYFSNSAVVRTAYVTMLCVPSTLITIHHEPTSSIENFVRSAKSEVQILTRSVQALFFHLIECVVMGGVPAWHDARNSVANLAQSIDEDGASLDAAEILASKRQTDHLNVICEDQLYCVSALRSIESPAFKSSELQPYFRGLAEDLSSGQLALTRLEERVRDLHQHYQITLQNVTNKRLNILAILSAVYLPSTLIAGIYGMNFQYVPILGFRYGYFVILVGMLLLVAGQIAFFWKRGWFK